MNGTQMKDRLLDPPAADDACSPEDLLLPVFDGAEVLAGLTPATASAEEPVEETQEVAR